MVLCKVVWPGVGVKVDFFRYPIFGGFCPTYGPKRKFFFEKYNLPLLRIFEVFIFGVAMDTFIFDGESCGCNEIG